MSLRFGSGWLVIYFLICSCTFKCSAPQLRARDYTTFNPFEPLPFSLSHRILGFGSPSPPLQGRAALTVEVARQRGRSASRWQYEKGEEPRGLYLSAETVLLLSEMGGAFDNDVCSDN